MPAIFCTKQRAHNLIALRDESNLYIALGRTTPWTDEENPDTPLASQDEVEELIYIKKITVKHAVKIDDPYDAYSADVEVGDYSYNYVDDDDEIYDTPILKLFLYGEILYSDIAPTDTTFRQIGILLNPKDSEGELLTDGEYLAASVADQGELLYVDNIEYVTRDPAQSEVFRFILNM